jgi:DNA-binding IclR family transcriptional regulator
MATPEEYDPSSAKVTSAIGKAFTVLRALRHARSAMTLTAIAEEAGIATSSAHSILSHLLEQDAVVQDEEKRYRLGPALLYLGASYARSSKIYRSVWIELVTAANELSVTAAMAVTWDAHHLVLNSHRGRSSNVEIPQGGRVPLDAGSWGKAYFATTGEEPPTKLARYTPATITDRAEFLEHLDRTRRLGYAVDDEEYDRGVGGVCSAITSDLGYEGLISLLAPKALIEELTFERMGDQLSNLAARASLALGDIGRLRLFGGE